MPNTETPSISRHVVRGACPHDCPDTCALLTTVENGQAIKVQGNPEHPLTAGVLCTKVSRYPERTYHAERVLTPLKRKGAKGEGLFTPVSWEEALKDIADNLKRIAAHHPEAIVPYSYAGTMGLVQGEAMAQRFFHRLGASQLERTLCSSAGGAALTYTLGGKLGMHVQHFKESRLILIWGSNSITSNLHFWRIAQEAKRDGARLICIDPRESETAEKCHQHIALRPGTDAALALSLIHELIKNNWLDHDYIERYTTGFEALKERALQYPPQHAATICGIDAEVISQLAYEYAHTAPAAIRVNYGVQRTHAGGNSVRAIACLPALIGAWRHRAGGMLLSSSGNYAANRATLNRPDLLGDRKVRTLNMSAIGNALLEPSSESFGPSIQALIVYNCNPVAVAPDSARVVKGLLRPDLFTVVLEHFQTDTADYADYILPATTQLEHWDIHTSYGHTDVLLNRPAISPLGEALPNTEIFRRLSQHMGWTDAYFSDDDLTLCRQAFGEHLDFDTLLAQGFVHLPVPDAPFAEGGFPTPSGRCEFFSERLKTIGLDPLPNYIPKHEEPSPQYPLMMISPPHRNYLNSSFVNLMSLRPLEGEPILEIHPEDALHRGINDGDIVDIYNARGHYHCKAVVSTRTRLGVVVGLGIWWRKMGRNQTNVNELTSQALTDFGGGATFYDCCVEVARL